MTCSKNHTNVTEKFEVLEDLLYRTRFLGHTFALRGMA